MSSQKSMICAAAVVAVSFCIILLFLALSFVSYPAADDYCYFSEAVRRGFLDAQWQSYISWSGRYSATALISILALLPPIQPYYALGPIVTLLLTLLSVSLLFYAIAARYFPRRYIVSAAMVFTAILVVGLPNIAQTIYWQIGAVTYQLGVVSFIVLLAIAIQRERFGSGSAMVFVVRFFLAVFLVIYSIGTNELTLIAVWMMLSVMLFVSYKQRKGSFLFWLALWLVGTSAAIFSGFAPGNTLRAATLSNNGIIRPSGWAATVMFVPWVILRLIDWAANASLWLSAFLLFLLSRNQVRVVIYRDDIFQRKWLLIPAIVCAYIFLAYGLGFYENHYPLPDRAETVLYSIFLLGAYPSLMLLFHYFDSYFFRGASGVVINISLALLALSLAGSGNVYEAVKDIYRGHRYAAEMKSRVDIIRQSANAGITDVEVPSVTRLPRTISVDELSTDPQGVTNRCMAQYYQVRTIRLGNHSY